MTVTLKMAVTEFTDLKNLIAVIQDLVIGDITYDDKTEAEVLEFRKRLYRTKLWFTPISSNNKRKFICALISDLHSIYAVSLLLKCTWIYCLKDAMMSICEFKPWINYDQVPLDHDRAVQLFPDLKRLQDEDRAWFSSLTPDTQALALCELLMISGGPIVNATLKVAQNIYDNYKRREVDMIRGNIASIEASSEVVQNVQTKSKVPNPPLAKQMSFSEKNDENDNAELEEALKERDVQLMNWNGLLSRMRTKLNAEEVNLIFLDGVNRTIWKFNKIDNRTIETVDAIQLLPASVGKRILCYLSDKELDSCAHVNKYWSYLVDDCRAEIAARATLQRQIKRIEEFLFPEKSKTIPPEDSLSSYFGERSSIDFTTVSKLSTIPSIQVVPKKMPMPKNYVPIKNLTQLTERIEIRGAADNVMFRKLESKSGSCTKTKILPREIEERIVNNVPEQGFVCPCWQKEKGTEEHCSITAVDIRKLSEQEKKSVVNKMSSEIRRPTSTQEDKRYNLWSTDFSSLHPVLKIAYHELPPM